MYEMSLKDAVGALRSLKAELEASRSSKRELEVAYRGVREVREQLKCFYIIYVLLLCHPVVAFLRKIEGFSQRSGGSDSRVDSQCLPLAEVRGDRPVVVLRTAPLGALVTFCGTTDFMVYMEGPSQLAGSECGGLVGMLARLSL